MRAQRRAHIYESISEHTIWVMMVMVRFMMSMMGMMTMMMMMMMVMMMMTVMVMVMVMVKVMVMVMVMVMMLRWMCRTRRKMMMLRWQTDDKTGKHTLCEPAQLETHMDISQEPVCVEMCKKNAGPPADHLNYTPACNILTPTVRTPQCGYTAWGKNTLSVVIRPLTGLGKLPHRS